jgi:hypothetical protein
MIFFRGALALVLALGTAMAAAQSGAASTVTVEFKNPQLSPSHWTLVLHPDGSGHFHSEHSDAHTAGRLMTGDVDRDITLHPEFVRRVFTTAIRKQGFHLECESHLKLAFQGWKTLSYSGPEGTGSCTFNYSVDKEINQLGEQMQAVATTLEEGARLEMFMQHDRLGLDHETEYFLQAARDGRAVQIGTIRGILERLAADESVLERVRKRARQLLAIE